MFLPNPDQQLPLLTKGAELSSESPHSHYLKFSTKVELQKRLSPKASIFLEGEEGFVALDARYTNYKRPEYIAAVQVAEEQDVIETVRYFLDLSSQYLATPHTSR